MGTVPAAAEELDRGVRLHIMRRLLDTGSAPTAVEAADALGVPVADVEASYRRLADGRAIVLEPGTLDVWMANPLSAVPTGFRVRVGDRAHWGNCVWDALGVVAMLGQDGDVATTCPDCGEAMRITVRNGAPHGSGVAHFAVPAAHWWDDIGYT